MSESLYKVASSSSSSSSSSDNHTSFSASDNIIGFSHTADITEASLVKAANDIVEAEYLINLATGNRAVDDARLEDVVNFARPDPFAHYECAFGFEADLSEPVHLPKTKGALCTVITEEVLAVIKIQGGLQSYCREINDGKHDFSGDFLEAETRATNIAVGQLENVKQHLKAVLKEVGQAGHDHHDVHDDLRAAYGHAVPWIRRYRQIAVHSHVFYKVNVSIRTLLLKESTNIASMSYVLDTRSSFPKKCPTGTKRM